MPISSLIQISSHSFWEKKKDYWFSFLLTAVAVVHLIRNMDVIMETPILFFFFFADNITAVTGNWL